MADSTELITAPEQLRFDLEVAAEREIDGVGMGVLSDGTPFLTLRGLARMCGVDHTTIIRITADWMQTPLRPREQKIRELVAAKSYRVLARKGFTDFIYAQVGYNPSGEANVAWKS